MVVTSVTEIRSDSRVETDLTTFDDGCALIVASSRGAHSFEARLHLSRDEAIRLRDALNAKYPVEQPAGVRA